MDDAWATVLKRLANGDFTAVADLYAGQCQVLRRIPQGGGAGGSLRSSGLQFDLADLH